MAKLKPMFYPGKIEGMDPDEIPRLEELLNVYHNRAANNQIKERYYEGHIPLCEVNLGVALPNGMDGLEIGCAWGTKTVDVLAARSMFDGFVGLNGEDVDQLTEIMDANNLIAEYPKACREELKIGCAFATLSADPVIGCKIRFHSATTAAALWNGEKGRIECGLAIIDTAPDDTGKLWIPYLVNYYTDDAIWVLTRSGNSWSAERCPHVMGRPLMEPLIYNPTAAKPFGQSRIKEPIRRLIQGYVRTVANATIGLEFSTTPQKYLLGVTDQQFDAVVNQKFKQYVGSIIASTTNPETGEKPTFGQLQQGTIDGQENPETSIDSASVQDVQKYISLWNAYYDCVFFSINQKAYDQFTDEQKKVIDENAKKAVEYQKSINRSDVENLVAEWKQSGVMEVTEAKDMDIQSLKDASKSVFTWYEQQLVDKCGMTQAEAQKFVEAFTQG